MKINFSGMLFVVGFLSVNCVEVPSDHDRDNPLDTAGTTWFAWNVQTSPERQMVAVGDNAVVAVKGIGGGVVASYRWYLDGSEQSATGDTLRFACQQQGSRIVRCRGINSDGVRSVEDTAMVMVRDKAPLLSSPQPDAVLENNNGKLQWYPGFYNNRYQVLVDTVNPPDKVVNSSVRDTFCTVSGLAYNKSYWWRVVGFDGNGASASSEAWAFTTPGKPPIPTEGLVAWYPFNGNAKDESGNGNDGVVYGAVLAGDRFGGVESAYQFGDSSYIIIKSTVAIQQSLPVTISAWIYIPSSAPQNKEFVIFANNYQYGAYSGIWMGISKRGHIYIGYGDGTGEGLDNYSCRWIEGTTVLHRNKWCHVIGILGSSNDMRIFLNSIAENCQYVGSGGSLSYSNSSAAIGRMEHLSTSYCFIGSIDDICVYNRALTNSEIQFLYHENGWTGD